jgi:hypothetical protein
MSLGLARGRTLASAGNPARDTNQRKRWKSQRFRRLVSHGGLTLRHLWRTSAGAGTRGKPNSEAGWLLIENKYTVIAAVVGFLLMLWLTDGSMIAAFGILALIAGTGWAIRRLQR